MIPVYLDTNAVLLPFQFGIRLDEEIVRLLGAFQIWIPEPVFKELSTLRGPYAQAAREFASRYPIARGEGVGDDAILEMALANSAVVVTNDTALRKRLKESGLRVLYMREKARLEWDL